MKKILLALIILSAIAAVACDDTPQTGSVFQDHQGVTYDDGSGLSDIMDGKDFFYGNLHAHTTYSDGTGTPAEGYQWARDNAGFDFYAVTDHAEQVSSGEWDDTGVQANLFTVDNVFVAIRGFEWSHTKGHANVYNTSNYTSALRSTSLSSFADWVDANNGLAQFNHPGRESNMFNDFSYDKSITDNVVSIETGNKGSGNNHGEYLSKFPTCLKRGWRVAPTNNQDNHGLSTNSHRTVMIANALTYNSLMEAYAARRVYSSDDPNMRVVFKVGAHWMGEVVNISAGNYTAIIRVEDDEPISKIEIISYDDTLVTSLTVSGTQNYVEWNPVLNVNSDAFYYVKVYGADTNNDESAYSEQIAVTAPIWLNVQ